MSGKNTWETVDFEKYGILSDMMRHMEGFRTSVPIGSQCSLASASTSQSREALCSAAKERSGIRLSGI